MPLSSQAIGVFDSGVGGLSVMRQLMRRLPNETFIYLGDTARVPYGNKSPETIIRYSIENTLYLLEKKIKLLVIACSTVSALAISELSSLSHVPVIGVIEPGVKKILDVSSGQRIAILGTRATIQSAVYQNLLLAAAPQAQLFPIACPLFVSLVEEGQEWISHPAAKLIVQKYLEPLQGKNVDTILLGCTHFPMLTSLIQEEMGPTVTIIDSAYACAEYIESFLQTKNSLSYNFLGPHQYFTTDAPEKFRHLAEHILGQKIESVEIITK